MNNSQASFGHIRNKFYRRICSAKIIDDSPEASGMPNFEYCIVLTIFFQHSRGMFQKKRRVTPKGMLSRPCSSRGIVGFYNNRSIQRRELGQCPTPCELAQTWFVIFVRIPVRNKTWCLRFSSAERQIQEGDDEDQKPICELDDRSAGNTGLEGFVFDCARGSSQSC